MLMASLNKLNQVAGELLKSVHAIQADMHKALEGRTVEGDKVDPKLDALQVIIPPKRWPEGMHLVLIVTQVYASGFLQEAVRKAVLLLS